MLKPFGRAAGGAAAEEDDAAGEMPQSELSVKKRQLERDIISCVEAKQIATALAERFTEGMSLGAALRAAVETLTAGSEPRELTASQLEVGVLDRNRPRRKFRRLTGAALESLLAGADTIAPNGGAPSAPMSEPTATSP